MSWGITDDKHFELRTFVRPGEVVDSAIWNSYIKLLVDPFADDDIEYRYSNEAEFHEIIMEVWSNGGVDNDVTVFHEDQGLLH